MEETSEAALEELAYLFEDGDEFLSEVLVEESVEKRVEAGWAHASKMADGVDTEHAVGRREQAVPLVVTKKVHHLRTIWYQWKLK